MIEIDSDAYKALEKFQRSPQLFLEQVMGVTTLEEYHCEGLQKIADNDRVAFRACHDVGKSWLLGHVVPWFGSCFPFSKIITTAPTYNQVKNILWAEINAAHSRSKHKLGGKMNLTEWRIDKDWFAVGFTPKNELTSEGGQGAPSSFQGFHAKGGILVIFDEATGVPNNIWTMAEGLLTQAFVKFIAIGNPTSRMSKFFSCFSSPDWTKIKWDCFKSPNLIANGITDINKLNEEIATVRAMNDDDARERMNSYKVTRPYLLSLKWVVNKGLPRNWGVDHPLFQSKVLSEFPTDSDGALIRLDYVEAALARVVLPEANDRKTLGCDIARFGSDSTVLTGLHGKKQTTRKKLIKKSTTEVTGEVINIAREMEMRAGDVIVVDGTGVGSGVVDLLIEAQKDNTLLRGIEIREVQFGAAVICDGPDSCDHRECIKAKFVNVKARMFRLLADDLRDCLELLNEDVYADELPTLLYSYNSKGQMQIESKDEYKRRTGRKSPDDADSLALANYGHYEEVAVGSFGDTDNNTGYARPFAASLGSAREW